ncbi:uncharacterized protein RHO17_014801 [Thomomys bottae]
MVVRGRGTAAPAPRRLPRRRRRRRRRRRLLRCPPRGDPRVQPAAAAAAEPPPPPDYDVRDSRILGAMAWPRGSASPCLPQTRRARGRQDSELSPTSSGAVFSAKPAAGPARPEAARNSEKVASSPSGIHEVATRPAFNPRDPRKVVQCILSTHLPVHLRTG